MKRVSSSVFVVLLLVLALPALAQEMSEDEKGIVQAGRDYFEAFYLADAEREAGALHPELVKRFIRTNQQGRDFIQYASRSGLIEYTASGAAKADLAEKDVQVEIFEINGNIATGKVTSVDFYDYVHFAKVNGKWYVLNVLWTPAQK